MVLDSSEFRGYDGLCCREVIYSVLLLSKDLMVKLLYFV